ncbi:MAG: TonB-dependent receptor [Verrucomicrobiales bacterium]|nr:TonB-dependent receptor [Verrucomicrobiales bacterium]
MTLHSTKSRIACLLRCSVVAAAFSAAIYLPVFSTAQEEDSPNFGPVIDDATSELDVTIVTSTPAPPREATPTETVRRATATRPVEIEVYDTIDPEFISGGAEETFTLPGSGYFVTAGEIRDQNYVNVNRVLARVPGVYVREEDGAGLFPNISIRGVDGTRSEKLTIMEDGILQAPAPYAAPSAYYSPNVARMAGVEILKGANSVLYGPNTTGGVINYLSTPIPEHEQFYFRSTYGSNSTSQIHSHYGNMIDTSVGRIGYLAEIYYKKSDGFRTIDPGMGIEGGDATGYRVIEPMIKLSWEPNTVLEQKMEFKYGFTDLDANESYLGLTDADFAANPYRRYAGSFLDDMATEQHRISLKHSIAVTDDLDVQVAGYYNQFERDWFKIRNVNGNSLHEALGPNGNIADLNTLRGLAPGTLGYRHNARTYEAYGVQFSGEYRFETGQIDHGLKFGVREHKDNVRFFQENTDVILGGSSPVINDFGPGSGGNRLQESNATAIWLQDSIEVGRFTFTPGFRHERVELNSTNFQSDATHTLTSQLDGEIDWWTAGIGVAYELSEQNSIFGGVHEGVATPGPSSILGSNVGLEESLSYELGFRHQSNNFNAELVGFLTDFDNIISTAAGLGQGATQNAGTGQVHGIEALVGFDPWQKRAVRLPMYLSATWTSTELDQALSAGGGEDIYGDGAGGAGLAGANLPYIPEYKVAAGIGLESDTWGVDLAASYVSDTFGTALNSPVPVTSSRQGEIDGGVIFDLGAYYQINNNVKLIGGVHNLFEEVMITSRIPEGARANAPREFYLGCEILWEPRNSPSGKSIVAK